MIVKDIQYEHLIPDIVKMWFKKPPRKTIKWHENPQSIHISEYEHRSMLRQIISLAHSDIIEQAGKGKVDLFIVGKNFYPIIASQPDFKYNEFTGLELGYFEVGKWFDISIFMAINSRERPLFTNVALAVFLEPVVLEKQYAAPNSTMSYCYPSREYEIKPEYISEIELIF